VFFVENLYAGVLKQMNDCVAIVSAIVSRVFHVGFTREFVCEYNELAFSLRGKIHVQRGFGADEVRR
jgi:hypothetical protein